MAEALGFGIGFCGDAFHFPENTAQRPGKSFIAVGGPKDGPSAGVEGIAHPGQAGACIDAGIALLHQRIRAVIDIQQDGMITLCGLTVHQIVDVLQFDGNPGLVHQQAIDAAEVFAVPVNNLGQQLGDVDGSIRWRDLQRPAQGETKPQPPN